MTIGEAIRAARESAGLSQSEAARLAAMSRQQLWNIESGRRRDPQWSVVVRIARAIGVSLDELDRRTLECDE